MNKKLFLVFWLFVLCLPIISRAGTGNLDDYGYQKQQGIACLKKKNYSCAIKYLEKAAQLAPNPGGIYQLLATAYTKAGQGNKARHIRRKMHELSQQNLELPPVFSCTTTIDDSKGGNGNGQLEAGEQAELVVSVSNYGKGSGFNVRVSLDSNSSYLPNTTATLFYRQSR